MSLGATGATANKLAQGSSYLFGAGYAAHAMNEEGKEMGLTRRDRLLGAMVAGSIVYGAEKTLDKLGASGFINRNKRKKRCL